MIGLPDTTLPGVSFRMSRTRALLGLLCVVASAGASAGGVFEVGQRWEYRHEGPRPGSMEPEVIDGRRVMHVISAVEGPGQTRWVIEERFTRDEEVIGRFHVNEKRLLTAIEIENEKGQVATLRYDPAVPYQVTELAVGEKKAIETTLRTDSAKFALPSAIVTQRLEDETITTAAGEFLGCRHYKVTTRSTFDIKIGKVPVTEERERWYHPRVNGLVKEIYRKGPVKFLAWSQEGYTATSVLTAFGKEDVEAETETIARIGDEDRGPNQRNDPPSRALSSTTARLMVLGVLGIATAGSYVFIRRGRSKRPAQN